MREREKEKDSGIKELSEKESRGSERNKERKKKRTSDFEQESEEKFIRPRHLPLFSNNFREKSYQKFKRS